MKNLIIYAVMICSLSACATSPVIKQAEDEAKANEIINKSLTDKLIAYNMSKQECEAFYQVRTHSK